MFAINIPNPGILDTWLEDDNGNINSGFIYFGYYCPDGFYLN